MKDQRMRTMLRRRALSKPDITHFLVLNGESEGNTRDKAVKNKLQSYDEESLRSWGSFLSNLTIYMLNNRKSKMIWSGLSLFLKDCSPEMHQKVLKMWSKKIPDYNLQGKMASFVPDVAANNGICKRILDVHQVLLIFQASERTIRSKILQMKWELVFFTRGLGQTYLRRQTLSIVSAMT